MKAKVFFLLIFYQKYGRILLEVKFVELLIDGFTPCLENTATGEFEETFFSQVTENELKSIKGWKFNWRAKDLKDTKIYKLVIKKRPYEIQGLVALRVFEKDMAVYVNIAESAPHNIGKEKKYSGVGGHLFAIAAYVSKELGFGGFVFMDAKNIDLVKHYQTTLGAVLLGIPHPYRMYIDEYAAEKLLSIYEIKKEES